MPVLARLDLRGSTPDRRLLATGTAETDPAVRIAVEEIVAAVRRDGDRALRDLTARFDGCRIDDLRVAPEETTAAAGRLGLELREALDLAADQIRAYHESQREPGGKHERRGVAVREIAVPVERAGCYVPGGRAAYPSTVLMTALPARVAGVAEVALCVPPGRDGRVADVTLAAAAIAGVDEVYRVGGAQAIAALAYGTESIRPVDVIVGPGNAFVAEAKRQVVGAVGIDSIAGPSEVAIVADSTTDPDLVAADLLAQAEHGPGGGAVLVTWDEPLAEAVDAAVALRLQELDRRDDAEATLASGGRVVLVDGPDEAIAAVNAIAPEHLQLMCAPADDLVAGIRNAGAVFCGADASAVVGDYVAGVNHVLPTGGTARFASALRVATFLKHVHVVTLEAGALAGLEPAITALAEAEGLTAHRDAVRLRIRPGDAP